MIIKNKHNYYIGNTILGFSSTTKQYFEHEIHRILTFFRSYLPNCSSCRHIQAVNSLIFIFSIQNSQTTEISPEKNSRRNR